MSMTTTPTAGSPRPPVPRPSRPSAARSSRRAFLKAGAAGLAGAVLSPERLLADPYAPLPGGARSAFGGGAAGAGSRLAGNSATVPVRVRGVVRADGRGLGGVAVSDGLQVVETEADGAFEIVTSTGQEFVWLSVPSGCRVPKNPSGTARFYQPLTAASEQTVAFDLERDPASHDHHTLLLLGDIQTQDQQEMDWFLAQTVPDLQESLRGVGDEHVFGIACGDIMYDDLALYPAYESGVQRLGVPFFQVVGNHDLDRNRPTDEGSTETFCRHFGPRNYSFDRGAVHYVVLDDVFWYGSGYIGYLDEATLVWLERDLARMEPGSPVVVATHIPVLGSHYARRGEESPRVNSAIANRDALYRLLEPFRAHVLVGHLHESEHLFGQGVHEHVVGAVCGAWWSGPICWDGAPNGYCLYQVRGEEVTWRCKTTGRPANHQMRLYAPGADPAAPSDLLANVWDWDPEWTVRWFADGDPRGAMERRRGPDPLSVELHSGPDLPARRPWVDPVPTDHLFRASLDGGESGVTVEATDRFGRTYAEEWRRNG